MAGILRTDTIQNSNTSNLITQTNSTTITIGTTGQTIALASGASSSGFGATYNGAVNWTSNIVTSALTVSAGIGYFVNTSSAAITATLPATPTAGNIVAFKDYAKTWNTNNLTIGRNGSNIEGLALNSIQNVQGQSITLIYVDSTKGWVIVDSAQYSELSQPQYVAATGGTITTCGNYKIHTFNSAGCFVVTSAGNNIGSNSVEYLVVAGGAGGASWGASAGGGGGGAGGYRTNYPSPTTTGLPVTATTYPITIGGGGGGGSNLPTGSNPGSSGSNSVFSTITSAGGGGGGSYPTLAPAGPMGVGVPGGSGGGGGGSIRVTEGGVGNSPPVSPSQGNPGGVGSGQANYGAGGGGGAGATGSGNPATSDGQAGGGGTSNLISGSSVTYAGGGGGAGGDPGGGPGAAGSGGGGTGGSNTPGSQNGTAGTTNRGGGGGGGGSRGSAPISGSGGTGGSGIVVIRYKYQ
jgi:hypothetical protein